MKRLDAMNENANAIHIFKREYSYSFKIPPYLPQNLKPQPISSACKRLSPMLHQNHHHYHYQKGPLYQDHYEVFYSHFFCLQNYNRHSIQTILKTNTVPKTVVTTIFYTTITSIPVTAQTITETIATETETTATITTTFEIETSTETASETTTEVATSTVVQTLACSSGIAACSLDHPDSCCSGQCIKWFATPNYCVISGQLCDIPHPEGCCTGTCKLDHYNNGTPIYTYW
ncbi:uncharacterized protein DFL_007510 [Arthrobotrys flagrans]|uniref:Uncharacterized protein n=1 Tax=Arthrobotrys flagrans TaxID=97331 RepID=A0A436ZW03_ARTFL|nr:hypothetical protein DFL_007510 [Arthrobotrys flagrans]